MLPRPSTAGASVPKRLSKAPVKRVGGASATGPAPRQPLPGGASSSSAAAAVPPKPSQLTRLLSAKGSSPNAVHPAPPPAVSPSAAKYAVADVPSQQQQQQPERGRGGPSAFFGQGSFRRFRRNSRDDVEREEGRPKSVLFSSSSRPATAQLGRRNSRGGADGDGERPKDQRSSILRLLGLGGSEDSFIKQKSDPRSPESSFIQAKNEMKRSHGSLLDPTEGDDGARRHGSLLAGGNVAAPQRRREGGSMTESTAANPQRAAVDVDKAVGPMYSTLFDRICAEEDARSADSTRACPRHPTPSAIRQRCAAMQRLAHTFCSRRSRCAAVCTLRS